MNDFRSILVAADFSSPSVQAFHWACSLGCEIRSRFTILHVVQAMHIVESDFGTAGPADAHLAHDAMLERMRELYAPATPCDVIYEIRNGDPPDEILNAAQQHNCDLIVMGTFGRKGLARILTGSVAESVMRRARCPVLSVRLPSPVRGASGATSRAVTAG